jgi:hypothetical protein
MFSDAKINVEPGNERATTGNAPAQGAARARGPSDPAMEVCARRMRALRREVWEREVSARGQTFDAPEESMANMIDKLEREIVDAKRVQALRRAEFIDQAPEREKEAAARLGGLLLHDPGGPFSASEPGASVQPGEGKPEAPYYDDTSEPAWLVRRLFSSEAGCQWLLDRWTELRAKLEPGTKPCWQYEEDFKAIRLLGRQPLDVVADPEVAEVFVASYAVDLRRRTPFTELRARVLDSAVMKEALTRLSARIMPTLNRRDPADGCRRLLALLDRATGRLDSRIKQFRKPAEVEKARKAAGAASDLSAANKNTERYIQQCTRSLGRLRGKVGTKGSLEKQ